ncbi:MAG: mechanosensitive ion channel domain-containing protein [Bdellovibrionia bacterium]
MTSKIQSQPWVQLERIEAFIQLEPTIVTLALVLGAWIISKLFLRNLPEDRHRRLDGQFKNLGFHLIFGTVFYATYYGLNRFPDTTLIERTVTYLGLATILSGSTIFVKAWRILVFEYLYLSHMRVSFPVLLVNLFTLLLSIALTAWIGAEIFNVRLTPLLATSAIFSLVLGLALQDTLGNLFAGVALQFDKPYEIGDWIEIQTGTQKWVGQVYDISWRATVLIGFGEEAITVPNRIMGQAQIANFATKYRPIMRNIIFRLPFNVEVARAKQLLVKAAISVSEIRKTPPPFVMIADTTESWINFKLLYFIDNFGLQFRIADYIQSRVLEEFAKEGINLAKAQIVIAGKDDPFQP